MNTVCLSAGHGAGDPGVVHNGLQEANLTIAIVKKAADILRKHSVGCLEVPDNLTLQGTINWINQREDQIDICVEVHINAGGGKGVEGWNYQGTPTESDELSEFLVNAVVAETGLQNRGIFDETQNRHGRLGFVHDTKPIAALIECAFIDGDYDYLKNDENITRIAKGVARGCLDYLKIQWRPELINPKPQVDPKDQKIIDLEKKVESYKKLYEDTVKQFVDYKKKVERNEKALVEIQKIVNEI